MITNSEVVFVRLLIPLMMGIYCFYNLESTIYIYFIASIISILFLVLIWLNFFYTSLRIYRQKYLIGILFSTLFFAFGGWICLLKKNTLSSDYFGNLSSKQLKVWISDEPQRGKETIRYVANVIGVFKNQKLYAASGKILITVKTDSVNPIQFNYGDELLINANYTPIAPSYNPGEFDFKAWLATRNIYQQVFLNQNEFIKTELDKGNSVLNFALRLRKEQVEVYKNLVKDKEAAAVASTLILGYRADLNSETLSSYSKTGTIHALSVSGMHVGIIYIVLNWVLSFLDKKHQLRVTKVIVICSLIWFYSLITGFSPSVLRSAIMLTVYILSKSFNKHTNAYNILAFTAFFLLVYYPFLIWDVGFQLSFLTVLGLIYLHPKIYKWLYFKQRWVDWLWSSIALSVAAQIATFPLSIYYFHQFPIYFIFSNLFILIPITLLMYMGIAILLFKLYFLAPIFEWMIIFMNNGLKWIANLPFSGVNQIWINEFQLSLLSIGLILGIIALANYKKQVLFLSILTMLIFQSSLSIRKIVAKHQKKIIFFTLQKGYAIAFIHAQKAVVLSHLNKDDKNFQFYIQPALDQLQVENVYFTKWDIDISLDFFIKKNHQINFNTYKILLLDKYFNYKNIYKTPAFNALLIHQNPKIDLNELQKSILFEALIIDATNYPKNVKSYEDGANKFQIQSHVLKKNKAYLIDLNNLP